MPRLVVRFFGSPEITLDGRPVALPRQRCIAILALLALAKKPITRASLASIVWPDELATSARANLRRHVHQLLQTLPPVDGIEWLLTGEQTMGWNPDAPVSIDVRQFEEALSDQTRYAEAVEWYRGDLLENTYEEFVLTERERLRSLFLNACFSAAMTARRERRFPEAIALADRILNSESWREDALRLGMVLRYESGNRSSALNLFEHFAKRLNDELGVPPTPETLAVRDAVLSNAPITLAGFEEAETLDAMRVDKAVLPFTGRRDEVSALDAAWSHAARRRGGTVFVGGEPGIGKSRLVAEFAARVAAQGGRALAGETTDPEAYPYEAIVDALRHGLRAILETPPAEPWLSALAEVLPECVVAAPGAQALEPLEGDASRARLFESFVRTIERLAKSRPVLLVLEDLHWARRATLDALEAVARRLATTPVLIAITYRSNEVPPGHPLAELRRRLQGQKLATIVDLRPLESSDVEHIVQTCGEAGDAALTASVQSRSGGSPLFIGLLLREFAQTGHIAGDAAPGIGAAVVARIFSLDTRSQTLARAASVVGRSFTTDLLAAVLGWNEGEVFEGLRPLVEFGFVRASESSAFSYTFTHGLIESSIYSAVPVQERVSRHRRIATVLDRMKSNERQALSSIARHWKLGGESARAALVFAEAARAARDVYAYYEAIALARAAEELETDERRRFEMLVLVADAGKYGGDRKQWERDVAALQAAAGALGDARARFVAMQAQVAFYSRSFQRDLQREAIESMLELARDLSPGERAEALHESGSLNFQEGRLVDCARELGEAIALGGRSDEATFFTYMWRVQALLRLGRRDEASEHVRVMRERCETTTLSVAARLNYLTAERHLAEDDGDAAGVLKVGQAMLPLAVSVGDMNVETWAHDALAYGALRLGSRREVNEHLDRGIELFERLNSRPALLRWKCVRSYCDMQFGLVDEALERIDGIILEYAKREGATTNRQRKSHACRVLVLPWGTREGLGGGARYAGARRARKVCSHDGDGARVARDREIRNGRARPSAFAYRASARVRARRGIAFPNDRAAERVFSRLAERRSRRRSTKNCYGTRIGLRAVAVAFVATDASALVVVVCRRSRQPIRARKALRRPRESSAGKRDQTFRRRCRRQSLSQAAV
ncbi:MAG: AAA family ATPase [Candidatus Eremiobacteraeota bacterium]|nr:AAA family ATPase [Candidatus Eremiobacteraeota bacterium]